MAYRRLDLREHFAEKIMDEWNWQNTDQPARSTPQIVQFVSELKARVLNYRLGLTLDGMRRRYY